MRKKLLGLLTISVCALSPTFAASIFGITADGDSQQFQIEEVSCIKIAQKKDGLKSFDVIKFDGTATGHDESGASYFIQTFPNPVSDYLTITGIEDDAQVVVLDMDGKEVQRTRGTRVEVSSLSQGLYVLVVNGQKVKFIKK